MAAPAGNKNAKGNSGGYGMPKDYREKQIELKKLMLEEMLNTMKGKDKRLKLALIMKHGSRALPAEIEGVGENGEIIIKVTEYAGGLDPASVRSGDEAVSADGASEQGEV